MEKEETKQIDLGCCFELQRQATNLNAWVEKRNSRKSQDIKKSSKISLFIIGVFCALAELRHVVARSWLVTGFQRI